MCHLSSAACLGSFYLVTSGIKWIVKIMNFLLCNLPAPPLMYRCSPQHPVLQVFFLCFLSLSKGWTQTVGFRFALSALLFSLDPHIYLIESFGLSLNISSSKQQILCISFFTIDNR